MKKEIYHIRKSNFFTLCGKVRFPLTKIAVIAFTNSKDICKSCLKKFDNGDFQ